MTNSRTRGLTGLAAAVAPALVAGALALPAEASLLGAADGRSMTSTAEAPPPSGLRTAQLATEQVRVVKIKRPGRVRVTNPHDRRIVFTWGNFFIEQIDGQVRVPADDSKVIRVHRRRIHWFASMGGVDVDSGTVRGIELPSKGRA